MAKADGTVEVTTTRRAAGCVAWITMRRGARLNALDPGQVERLIAGFAGLAATADLRAVVLTGEGRAFIGGADIDTLGGFDEAGGRRFITRLHAACAAIRACPAPVIARINGYCLGAGLEVAAACDLRVAAADARFAMPEVRVGLPSVIEAALLPRLVGWGKAAELVLTGLEIDAAEAHRIGLVQRVVPAALLDDAVETWLAAFDAAGPAAVRSQKALLRQWERLPLDEAVSAGIEALAAAYREGEPNRMIAAFKVARAAARAEQSKNRPGGDKPAGSGGALGGATGFC